MNVLVVPLNWTPPPLTLQTRSCKCFLTPLSKKSCSCIMPQEASREIKGHQVCSLAMAENLWKKNYVGSRK